MRSKRLFTLLVLALMASMLFACQTQTEPAPAQEPAAGENAAEEAPAEEAAQAEGETAAEESSGEIVVPDIYMWSEGYELEWVDTSEYVKDPPYKIGFSNCSTSNAWAVLFWETAKWEAAKHPEIEEFFTTDAGDNAAKQLSDIEDLLAKDIDVLIVRPCTLDAGVPGIERAMEMGIPVLISNRSTATDQIVSQATTSMVEMGRNQATWLVEQLGGEGTIVSIEGPAGSGPQVERYQGAMEVLDQYPDIEVVARQQTLWSRAEAKAAMEDYLLAFPEIDGVLSQAGIMSSGIVEAIEEAGIDPCTIPVTGDDYNGWMKWIEENGCGMITTNPNWCSGSSIYAALMVLNGQPVPAKWYIQTTVYDTSNISEVVVVDRSDEWYTSILPADYEIQR